MNNNNSSIGWVLAVIVFIALIIGISVNSSAKTNSKNTQPTYTTTKATTAPTTKITNTEMVKQELQSITWHCIDATSYNKNPYDDNLCTSNTGEARYVSDSQARALDPSYIPGTYGHPYYNSK